MNYAYLSGYLQSALENLAYDHKFLKMKGDERRRDYLREMVREAQLKAIEFESEVNSKMIKIWKFMSNKNKRIKYNTPLEFPQTFTLRELRNANANKMKLITIYSRVQNGIEDGTIEEVGIRQPSVSRRGRKEIVYKMVETVGTPACNITPITDGNSSDNPFWKWS